MSSILPDIHFFSGLEFERWFFGLPNLRGYSDSDIPIILNQFKNSRILIKNFFEEARFKQPKGWDTRCRNTNSESSRLFGLVKDSLLKSGEVDQKFIDRNLRLMVTVGTPVDLFFGTDCYFEFSDSSVFASVDLSLREKDEVKADVLLTFGDVRHMTDENRANDISETLLTRYQAKQEWKRKRLGRKKRSKQMQLEDEI